MSIAEKLTAIAQNVQKVYDAGKAAGGGTEEDMLKFANTVSFKNLNEFGKSEVVLNLDRVTVANNMFNDSPSNTTVKHLTVNLPLQAGGAYQMFAATAGDLALERLTLNADFSKAQSCAEFLRYRRALKVVDGTPLDFSSVPARTNISILECGALEEIRFAPNTIKTAVFIPHSPYLSGESMQSILDGLADLTGSTTQTLTFHADVGARLTEEQKAAVTAKNWTLSY